MSILRIAVLGLLAIVLLVLALANLDPVLLRLLPEPLADGLGIPVYSVRLPLFAVVLVAVGLGIALGYVLEWLREHRHRRAATRERARREKLERELARSRGTSEGDEVLALVERPNTARA